MDGRTDRQANRQHTTVHASCMLIAVHNMTIDDDDDDDDDDDSFSIIAFGQCLEQFASYSGFYFFNFFQKYY